VFPLGGGPMSALLAASHCPTIARLKRRRQRWWRGRIHR
jgi:hypothetical protein